MVDDVITASKCGATGNALNSTVNTFMKMKKLELNEKKCAKVHIGNKRSSEKCNKLKVGNEYMNNSEKEKYLGDFVTKAANSKETIKDRKRKG